MVTDLYKAALNVNDNAHKEDMNWNHTNYGVAVKCADVLKTLGEEVDMSCWDDAGYFKIEHVTINWKRTLFHIGHFDQYR